MNEYSTLGDTKMKFNQNLTLKGIQFSSVQFSRSAVSDCLRPHELQHANSRSSLKLTSIESVMPSSHLILCRPLLLLPPIPPSIKVFQNESTLHMRWPKYQSFSFNISPSNEHSGLISFRMDWLDLLAVHGTLKSSPAPQFESIHSSMFSLLYGPIFVLFFIGSTQYCFFNPI